MFYAKLILPICNWWFLYVDDMEMLIVEQNLSAQLLHDTLSKADRKRDTQMAEIRLCNRIGDSCPIMVSSAVNEWFAHTLNSASANNSGGMVCLQCANLDNVTMAIGGFVHKLIFAQSSLAEECLFHLAVKHLLLSSQYLTFFVRKSFSSFHFCL